MLNNLFFRCLKLGCAVRFSIFLLCILISLATTMAASTEAVAATYYIDASAGNDSNNGLSAGTAWKTLAKINQTVFKPGDNILFKRGESWNGSFNVNQSGQPESYVVFGAYGSSSQKPKITNKTVISSWASVTEGIFKHDTGGPICYVIFENGKKIKEASSVSLSDGRWFFDKLTQTIYYRPIAGVPSNHVVEYSGISYLARITGFSYIKFSDISFSYAGGGLIIRNGSRNIIIESCDLDNFAEQAIQFFNTAGYCDVIGNRITNSGDGVYLIEYPGNGFKITNNYFSNMNYDELNNNDGHAIGIQNSSDNLIEKNYIEYSIDSIAIWARAGSVSSNNIVRYNEITNSKKSFAKVFKGQGIALSGDADNGVVGNKVYYNKIHNVNYAIKMKRLANPGNEVYNNTISFCNNGIVLSNGANNNIIMNNIIHDSTFYHIFSEHSSNGPNNIFDYNVYFPDGPKFMHRSAVQKNFSEWKVKSLQDKYSIAADPRFKDFSSFDLHADSPAVDAGKNMGINLDFSDRKAPSGSAVDIGCQEHLLVILSPGRLRLHTP